MSDPDPSSPNNIPPEVQKDFSPERFIRELWGIFPKDYVAEFFLKWEPKTTEDPDAKPLIRLYHYPVEAVLSDFPTVFANLQKENKKFFNIHPCVNPRFRKPPKRGRNSDVDLYGALWADFDYHGQTTAVEALIASVLEYLKNEDLWPSAIVNSGHGKHLYWLLDRPYSNAEARPCCAGIQDICKLSDPISDPSRVLRMPGTVNTKDKDNLQACDLVDATWRRYPLAVFRPFAVTPGKSSEEREEEKEQKKISDLKISNPDIETILQGVGEGERNSKAAQLAGWYFGKGLDADHVLGAMVEWNKKNTPPLDDAEIKTVVESIGKAEAAKPKEKKKGRPSRPVGPMSIWFDEDGKFIPSLMTSWLMKEHKVMATPEGKSGRGVEIYTYQDGVYHEGGITYFTKESDRLLSSSSRKSRVDEVVDLMRIRSQIPYRNLNQKGRELINLRNGMLDWRTGELKPHNPEYLSVTQLPVEYDPAATSTDLDQFFTDIFPPDCVALAEEFMGYLMIPDTSLQKCFIAVGTSGNGKGTFLKLLALLLGEGNVSSMSIHSLEEDKFGAANLLGKLANIHHDLDNRLLESTGMVKTIVSGDPISAENKYEKRFDFTPFARLVFSANEFPRANDKSDAWFDRLIFVPFPKKFRGQEGCILEYEKVLAAKPGLMSALLNRAIAGLKRLMETRRFSQSDTSKETVETYRRECNSALDFVHQSCSLHPEASGISRRELYSTYKEWCADSGMKAFSNTNFCKTLRTVKGVKETAYAGNRAWAGIQWKDNEKPETDASEARGLFGKNRDHDDGEVRF